MNETEKEYETHDIYLAAYFKVCGCALVRQRRQGPRKFFVFTNVGGTMAGVREDYFAGRGRVDPYAYAQQVVAFKQMCFEAG